MRWAFANGIAVIVADGFIVAAWRMRSRGHVIASSSTDRVWWSAGYPADYH